MTPPATHIFDIAEGLKVAVADIYADAAVSLPTRQAVVEGFPAFDCESMLVELRSVFRGIPDAEGENQTLRCMGIRTAEFHIWIIRCTSTNLDDGTPPTTANMENLARDIYIDAWLLPSELQERAVTGDLGPSCNDISIGSLAVIPPQGGYGGVDLTLQWQLGSV